uniref:Interspersed repeat antigen n=1 Tax=Babesia microti TaxID=5868 RepID=K7YBD2_BABMI|nr:interspersed repeat antigen [Babesia microti]
MMKINIDKIILINLIVLLNRNVVYCVNKNDGSLSESQSVPTNIYTGNNITTNTFWHNVIFYGDKLSHPNKINKIKFSDYIIEFDDDAKLPIGTVLYIIIYTCKHNNPVLVEFYVSKKGSFCNYFYSMDNDTNKWNNHKLKYDNRFKKHTDKNGINYYEFSDLKSCFSCFFVNKYEYTELAKEHCKKEICVKLDDIKIKDKNLKIYVKPFGDVITPVKFDNPTSINPPTISTTNNITDVSLRESQPITTNIDTDNTITTNTYTGTAINANFVRYREFEDEPLTIGFRYTIDKSEQDKLSYPNKIDKIKFSDYIIEFDDDVKLPIGTVNIIYIYTCKHNNPVLVEFIVSTEKYYYYYFYSMNNDTNKWNNHKIKYDRRYKEEYTDDNNTIYYKNLFVEHSTFLTNENEYEDTVLARIHCNEGKCVNVNVDNIENKNLEIYVKQLMSVNTPVVFDNNTLINPTSSSGATNDITYELSVESQPVPTNIDTGNNITTNTFWHNVIFYGDKLSHPNKINKIKFSDYIIEFDDDAKLPIGTVLYIIIYTCKHNNPVLVEFYVSKKGSFCNYFYSMDNDTNKWNNHKLKYDNRFKKHTDKNGINYYEISDLKSCFSCFFVNKYEYTELAKEHCKKEICVKLDNIKIKDNNLEIYVK